MEKSSQSSLDLVNNGVNFIRNPFIVGHNQNDLCAAMIKDPDKIKKNCEGTFNRSKSSWLNRRLKAWN